MSTELAAWQAYVEGEIRKLLAVPTVAADWGTEDTPSPGWVSVSFGKVFPGVPGVVAVQGARSASPQTQTLKPPKVTAPTLSAPKIVAPSIKAPIYPVPKLVAPSLTPLLVKVPATQQTWGDQAKTAIINGCGSTIGQIPVIGGYICSGIAGTFGALFQVVFNGIQSLYYAFDLPALVANIEQSVEAKIAADWNDAIAKSQAAFNATFDSINGALGLVYNDVNGAVRTVVTDANGMAATLAADTNGALGTVTDDINGVLGTLAADAQDAVNAVYGFLNAAIGLFEGMAIPVCQIRNVTSRGFEVYSAGHSTPIYWLALYA